MPWGTLPFTPKRFELMTEAIEATLASSTEPFSTSLEYWTAQQVFYKPRMSEKYCCFLANFANIYSASRCIFISMTSYHT
jgi:hypothetical protein